MLKSEDTLFAVAVVVKRTIGEEWEDEEEETETALILKLCRFWLKHFQILQSHYNIEC